MSKRRICTTRSLVEMELRHLEHFLAVAEERHFTRAAARLHIVQSGLSASVRSLERELGVQLFLRTTQRVELTEAGRALLGEARRTLAAAAAARDAVLAVQELAAGRLSVGVMQSHRMLDIPGMLGRFHRRHPRVELNLQQAASDQLIELVRTGRVEVAFLSPPTAQVDGLELTDLYGEDLLLTCAPGHPLADRDLVELTELTDVPFADFPVGWGTRRAVDQVFAAAGLRRRSAFEMNDVPLLLSVVAEGLAVGFVPAGFAQQEPGLRFVPVRPAPYWQIALAHAAGGPVSAAGRALCAQVRET